MTRLNWGNDPLAFSTFVGALQVRIGRVIRNRVSVELPRGSFG